MTKFDPFSIANKAVLIIGGTAGIGLGVANYFARQEAQVVITGRRSSGKAVAEGIGVEYVHMDISQSESITSATAEAAEKLSGNIDVLILNAGVDLEVGRIDALNMHQFRRIYEVNVFGLAQCLREGLAFIANGASIIVTSSPAGTKTVPGMSGYGSSKAAVNYLTRAYAAELAPRQIRVNAVLPGIVESEMAGSSGDLEFIRALTLTGSLRKPDELAPTFQYLSSAASAPLTGAIIEADDGISAGMSLTVAEAVSAFVGKPEAEREGEF